MKDILVLTKVLYKNSLGSNSTNKNTKNSTLGKIILIILVFAYALGFFGFFSYEVIKVLIGLHQEEVFISFSFLLIFGFTLLRTILTAINILYFSKDVEFLLPLPLEPIKIVFAKFNVMLISNVIGELLVFGVPFIIYWYLVKISPVFLLNSLLVFLVMPIIPMLLSSIVIVLIMRFTSVFKNKDIVQYISVVLTILFVVGVQFLSSSSNETSEFVLANKMVEINGYSNVVTKYFFTIKQGTEALLSKDYMQSMKNMTFLYLESISVYIITIFLMSKTYLKSALRVTSSGIKASKVKLNTLGKRSVGITYIRKEFKELIRTPVYLMQCVVPSFLFPIIFSIPIYREYKSINLSTAAGMDLKNIISIFSEVLNSSFGIGSIIALINLLYVFNFISATSISREGENALFMKYIPIPLSRQYKYKAIPGFIVNLFPLAYVLTILVLVFPNAELVWFLQIILLAIISNIVVNYFAVFIDLMNPKLHWSTEYAVVKQNTNMLYSFVLSLVMIGIDLGISSYIDDTRIYTLVFGGLMIAILIAFEIFLRKFENKIFKKIS